MARVRSDRKMMRLRPDYTGCPVVACCWVSVRWLGVEMDPPFYVLLC